jgi:phosphatidate cytidylyltransferase
VLRQRIVTAVILAALLLSALFYMPFGGFVLVLGAFFLVGAWEWGNFAKLNFIWRSINVLTHAVLMLCVWHWLQLGRALHVFAAERLQIILLFSALFWLIAILLIITYPKTARLWSHFAMQLSMGVVVLIPAWLSLVYLTTLASGSWLVIMVAMVVTCADSGAYFTGHLFGKNKLAPAVSPGKSWEGFFGGVAANVIFALIVMFVWGRGWQDTSLLLIIVVTSVISVFGDLFESMLKRQRGIKDSGIILPGHGGVLDRIDSITAAAPIFTLLVLLTTWSW